MPLNFILKYRYQEEADAGTGDGATGDADTKGKSTEEGETTGKSSSDIKAEGEKAEGEKAEGEKAEGEKAEGEKAEGEKAEGEKAEGEKAEGEKAEPDKYEAFEVPEGYENSIDEVTMEEFSTIAKDLNLNQEEAQKLVDYEINRQEKMLDAYQAQTDTWFEESKVDKEIGGADFELKQAKAHAAYEALATEEFRTLMNPYHPVTNPKGQGLGNHPEVVRLFYRIGLKMGEDSLITSDVSGEGKLERQDVLYGDT